MTETKLKGASLKLSKILIKTRIKKGQNKENVIEKLPFMESFIKIYCKETYI